jgi:ATP-dependent DNA helicase RecQ
MSPTLDERIQTVESMLGFTLRSHQRQALTSIGQGKNVILHVPTGGGKTVAFQGAPYVSPHPGITVILYPLRALVKDQTRRFKELGLPAATLYGETPTKDRPAIYDRIADGTARFLLTTPESFDMNRKLQAVLASRGVNVLAVDEAHAYEEWADNFRPVYRRAGRIAELVGVKQFLLCSATLTKKGFRTATETLGQSDWTIVQVPPIRSNLNYRDLSVPGDEIIARAVQGTGLDAPGIVFFTTVKCLNETADWLDRRSKTKVLRYHGSMTGKERRKAQETFMKEDVWILATKAFGMGIDKDNIRNIIHYQLPSSVLSYAQECGRAGRDGLPANCWLTQEEQGQAAHFLTEISVPSIKQVRRVWNILQTHALDYADWFEVDWPQIAERAKMYLPAVQACVSWMFTGKMIEKKQKRLSWKFIIGEDADEKAVAYKRKTPEILDLLRGEAMVGQGPSEFFLKPQTLAETVGEMFVGWRAKLRKMKELGIIDIKEPPKGRSKYRFLHNSFEFAQGEKQLKRARNDAFSRLSGMKDLQAADPSERQTMIEEAISLRLPGLPGLEILDCEHDEPIVSSVMTPRPKMMKPNIEDDPFADPLGSDEFTLDF